MTVRSGRRARKQPAEVRREEILDAAVRVFAHASFRAAGTADIARAAGIAEPTIYRHFGSKRELYLAALERCCAIVRDEFRRIAERTEVAAEAMHAMGAWYDETIAADPDYLRLRMRAVAEAEDDEVREALRRGYMEIVAIIAEVIRRGQEQGAVPRTISDEGAAWLFCGVGQVMDLFNLVGMDGRAQQWCEEVVAIYKGAVMTRPV